jgi:murein DD-endopeptidase MepM/ murein hydrolase activator NlpD
MVPPQAGAGDSAAPIPAPPPISGDGFIWPVQGKIISAFGTKDQGHQNDGINISAARGTPVRATENGVVAYAGNELRGFGNLVLIRHADGWITAYAHNEELLVRRGQIVRKGQDIATVGSSGGVGEPQLHFQMRQGKNAVDPTKQLRAGSA